MLNRAEASTEDNSENDGNRASNLSGAGPFKELLGLCKSDLDDILNKIKAQIKSENVED